jgi:hypothetical protein
LDGALEKRPRALKEGPSHLTVPLARDLCRTLGLLSPASAAPRDMDGFTGGSSCRGCRRAEVILSCDTAAEWALTGTPSRFCVGHEGFTKRPPVLSAQAPADHRDTFRLRLSRDTCGQETGPGTEDFRRYFLLFPFQYLSRTGPITEPRLVWPSTGAPFQASRFITVTK